MAHHAIPNVAEHARKTIRAMPLQRAAAVHAMRRFPIAPLFRPNAACTCGGGCPRCERPATLSTLLGEDAGREREADRIADEAMTAVRQAPSTVGQARAAVTPNVDPTSPLRPERRSSSNGLLDRLPASVSPPSPTSPLASLVDHLGRTLGAEFSTVHIHADSTSAALSHALGARAFTLGGNVYFGSNQFRPGLAQGRRLLAHELVHVAQQRRSGARLQRSPYDGIDGGSADIHDTLGAHYADQLNMPSLGGVQYTEGYGRWLQSTTATNARFLPPTFRYHNPLHRMAGKLSTGYTDLIVNGASMNPPGTSASDYLAALQPQLSPSVVFSPGLVTGQIACSFDPSFQLQASARVDELTPPPKGGWKARIDPGLAGGAGDAACAAKSTVPVTLNGHPNDEAYRQLVHASEMEHVADLRVLHDRHFVPYHRFVLNLSATAGNNADCESHLRARLGKRAQETALAFMLADLAESRKHDEPGSTHQGTLTPTIASGCSAITLVASQRNPAQPGAGPGNVQPVASMRTTIDPDQLSTTGSTLMSGPDVIRVFASAADAASALGMLAVLAVTEIERIGQVEVLLSQGRAASGGVQGIPGRDIDPARYQVTIGVPNAGDWVISQVDGDRFIPIVEFGAARDDAFAAVALMRRHQVRRQSWLGSAASPQMLV